MDKAVYEKFAGALRQVHAVKVAEDRRAAVYAKVAEAIEARRMEKSAAGDARMVGRGLSHVLKALRGGGRGVGEVAAGKLAPLNPGLGDSLTRTGISLQRLLSPEVNIRGKWDPRRLLTYVTRTARNADNSSMSRGAASGGDYSGAGIPTFGSLPHPGGLMEKRRLSPLKTLVAAGLGTAAGAGAYSAGGTSPSVAKRDPLMLFLQRIMGNPQLRNALIGAGIGGAGTALLSDGDIGERLLKGLAGAAVAGGATYAAPHVLDAIPKLKGTNGNNA